MRARAALLALAITSSAFAKPPSPGEQCAAQAEAGQRLRASGSLRGAREKFTSCGGKSCPRTVQTDCARWLEEVSMSLPSAIFRAYGRDKAEILSANVTIDDEPTTTNGIPYVLDPGPHTLRIQTEDGTAEEKFLLVLGEKNRNVSLRVPSAEATPFPPPAPPPESAPVVLYVGVGLGLAAMTTGAILWGVGASDHSALQSSCAPAGVCSRDSVSSAQLKLIAGDLLFPVGLVLTGLAVYFIWQTPSATKSAYFQPWITF
jgi:hypothetical protein